MRRESLGLALTLLGAWGCSKGDGWQNGQGQKIVSTAGQRGRLTGTGDGRSRVYTSFDALGRPVETIHAIEGDSYRSTIAYGYPSGTVDGLGSVVSSTTFPDGETTAYAYDLGGAEQRIVTTPAGGNAPAQTIVSRIERNARGQTTRVDYGNGASQLHTYHDDGDLRLDRIQAKNGDALLLDYAYGFDPNGNIVSIDDGVRPDLSAHFEYDALDRLVAMTTPAGRVLYGYDDAGNLVTKDDAPQCFGAACGGGARGPHALGGARGATFDYDANGNLVASSEGLAIAYDAQNMPVTVSRGGAVVTRRAYADGRLFKREDSGTITLYVGSLRIENGKARKRFGEFAERDVDGSLKFYHSDQLGSSTLVTDASGQVAHRAAYKPYGEERDGATAGSFTPTWGFNGRERDESGLLDYGARLFDPTTGVWITADSALDDGPNRYAYVAGNPLKYNDPTGHALNPPPETQNPAAFANGSFGAPAPSLNDIDMSGALPGWMRAVNWVLGGGRITSMPITGGPVGGNPLEAWASSAMAPVNAVSDAKQGKWGHFALDAATIALSVAPFLKGAKAPAPSVIGIGEDMAVTASVSRTAAPKGFTLLWIHGDGQGGFVKTLADGSAVRLTPTQVLAEAKAAGYRGGPILLGSCGAACGGASSGAQGLANAARQPVGAPDGLVGINKSGTIQISPLPWSPDKQPQWQMFGPAGGSR